jgi:hypothetical protein
MTTTADGWPRDTLRVRRYVNGTLEGEYQLARTNVDTDAVLDAQWCADRIEAGDSYRIVIDDPWGDVPPITLVGGGPR